MYTDVCIYDTITMSPLHLVYCCSCCLTSRGEVFNNPLYGFICGTDLSIGRNDGMKWVQKGGEHYSVPNKYPSPPQPPPLPFLLILKSRVVLIAFLRKAHITYSHLALVYFSSWCTPYQK